MTLAPNLRKERTMRLTHDIWTDLADRESDGLEVTLLWSESSGRAKVVVDDVRLDERFELDVPQSEALSAFYHPFAYAPHRTPHLDRTASPSTDLQFQS
jgi:hypothetical protein